MRFRPALDAAPPWPVFMHATMMRHLAVRLPLASFGASMAPASCFHLDCHEVALSKQIDGHLATPAPSHQGTTFDREALKLHDG